MKDLRTVWRWNTNLRHMPEEVDKEAELKDFPSVESWWRWMEVCRVATERQRIAAKATAEWGRHPKKAKL